MGFACLVCKSMVIKGDRFCRVCGMPTVTDGLDPDDEWHQTDPATAFEEPDAAVSTTATALAHEVDDPWARHWLQRAAEVDRARIGTPSDMSDEQFDLVTQLAKANAAARIEGRLLPEAAGAATEPASALGKWRSRVPAISLVLMVAVLAMAVAWSGRDNANQPPAPAASLAPAPTDATPDKAVMPTTAIAPEPSRWSDSGVVSAEIADPALTPATAEDVEPLPPQPSAAAYMAASSSQTDAPAELEVTGRTRNSPKATGWAAPARKAAGSSPQAICAALGFFERGRCVARQCAAPRFKGDLACIARRRGNAER